MASKCFIYLHTPVNTIPNISSKPLGSHMVKSQTGDSQGLPKTESLQNQLTPFLELEVVQENAREGQIHTKLYSDYSCQEITMTLVEPGEKQISDIIHDSGKTLSNTEASKPGTLV
jgi:hypothetical protein